MKASRNSRFKWGMISSPRLLGKSSSTSVAVEMARRGAKRVIGIDIREEILHIGRQKALAEGVQDVCLFTSSTKELADIVVSADAFEHFADPAGILRIMSTLLRPTGEVVASFGPTWYHPLGGHLFSVFPWASDLQRGGPYPLALNL